jgi:hypothetical protein
LYLSMCVCLFGLIKQIQERKEDTKSQFIFRFLAIHN